MIDPILLVIIAVKNAPGLTGRKISDNIIRSGHYLSKTEVNQILYRYNKIFRRTVDRNLKPSWYLNDAWHLQGIVIDAINRFEETLANKQYCIGENIVTTDDDSKAYPDHLNLYPWQKRALGKWSEAGYVGIIEAVTGTGKTRVALAAIEEHCRDGWKIAVIVPTIELQDQWYNVIHSDLIAPSALNIKIGRLGNGYNDSLGYYDVLITTSASAYRKYLHKGDYNGLLIADECHHYGAKNWSRALEDKFKHRLGLTATYDRDDGGKALYLDPYFNNVCYTLGYDEALTDGVIANFKIAFIGFSFNNTELAAYEKHNKCCTRYRSSLINRFGVTPEPFGEFMKEVTQISRGGEGQATMLARYYLNSFNQRRQILSNSEHKRNGLAKITGAIEKADRTIIFTQTKKAAIDMVGVLNDAGLNAASLDATMDRIERRNVLIGFEDGTNDVVAAPMLLDEGIDVPAADLAIVVASSRNKRQMIQRMGRVLRKKRDGRLARIAIFYIEDTSEDPAHGAHSTYIDLIRDSADDVQFFSITNHTAICDYLNDW